MSKRTKKVGNTGWMGPRYGIRIRRRVLDLDRARAASAACPRCSTITVDRVASGVFECRRCGAKYASGAYLFSPPPPITRSDKPGGETAPAAAPKAPSARATKE